MSIYTEVQNIAASGERILVAVSRGRDSLCMVHAMLQHIPSERMVFLHLQTYLDLAYQAQHIAKIESRLGIHLEIQPYRERQKILTGRIPSFSSERDHWAKHYDCAFTAYGFRSDESVSRAVVMREWPDGINRKSREAYPLKRWNRAIVATYATKNRLPMAPEYDAQFRDCGGLFTGNIAVWLHDTFPDDFERAAAFDPMVRAEYTRATGLPA